MCGAAIPKRVREKSAKEQDSRGHQKTVDECEGSAGELGSGRSPCFPPSRVSAPSFPSFPSFCSLRIGPVNWFLGRLEEEVAVDPNARVVIKLD